MNKPMYKSPIKSLILVLFIALLIIPSCDKNKEQDLRYILTSKSWRLVSFIDLFGAIPIDECNLDDCLRFNPDGTFTLEEGSIDCPESQSYEVEPDTWSLTENGLTITFNGLDSYDIDISEDKLFISSVFGSITFLSCSGDAYLKESQRRKEILMSRSWKCGSCDDYSHWGFSGCWTFNQDGTVLKDGHKIFDWEWSEYGYAWYMSNPLDIFLVAIESISPNKIIFTISANDPYGLLPDERFVFIPC